MSTSSIHDEAEKYINMSEEELYSLLIPDDDLQLYGKGARVVRGKNTFAMIFERIKKPVCKAYNEHTKSLDNAVDLTALIAQTIFSQNMQINVPVIPVAALIVKTGLLEICKKEKK